MADPDTEVDSELGGAKRIQISRALAFEMAAVLCIAYFPFVISAVTSLVLYGPYHNRPTATFFYRSALTSVLTTLPVLYILHRSGDGWAAFGIVRPKWRWDVIVGLAALAVHLASNEVWTYILNLGVRFVTSDRASVEPTVLACVLMLPSVLAGAFSEELAMRGYLMRRLESILGNKAGSVLFSSLAFASYHVYQGPHAFVKIFVSGLIYGITFALTRRLWPVVFAHAAWDMYVYIRMWV